MSPKKARPATWGSGPGLDDFAGRRESRHSLAPNALQTQAARRLRRQQLLRRLHDLGAPATAKFITETTDKFGIEGYVDERLLAYTTRLTPAMLAAAGGDRFATNPTRVVGGGR